MNRNKPGKSAFTLIELLVVVTIIVVLLALLTPAMDKAIYQAELAVCGTQVRSIATGVTSYAMDSRRYYPSRGAVINPPPRPFGAQPVDLAYASGTSFFDDRDKLKGYLAMGRNGQLNCPLTGKIDIEGARADTWIMSPYALYFGWSFVDPDKSGNVLGQGGAQLRGMNRMGDRMTWRDSRFNVLACDDDLISNSQGQGYSTHPNEAGIWTNLVWQDNGVESLGVSYMMTISRWEGSPLTRGPVDLNFALGDTSVMRLNKVGYKPHSEDSQPSQGKVVPVPFTSRDPGDSDFYRHLPAAY